MRGLVQSFRQKSAFFTFLRNPTLLLLGSAATMATARGHAVDREYYRADGVRITHDPYAPGMVEKYGKPGQTDNEGFDPYADSVGPGIYGGVVKRDPATGEVVIGRQYQNHNPRPGPVYAGGGYAPIAQALQAGDTSEGGKLRTLLKKYPDLANDITTGGAQPLHMCGMSRPAQRCVDTLVEFGADIEALDTYGMTPLHRMASNNLAIGAQQLLEAGADPDNRGAVGATPEDIARQSRATGVLEALAKWKKSCPRGGKVTGPNSLVIDGAGEPDINGEYTAQPASRIPASFKLVCDQQGWNTNSMWTKLNGGRGWFQHKENESYVYYNSGDGKWWIDAPDGLGRYISKIPYTKAGSPPAHGWEVLNGPKKHLPTVRAFRGDK